MKKAVLGAVAASLMTTSALAQVATGTQGPLRPDQQKFFDLYKELVETDTSVNGGSCTQAAAQIATRMKAAGFTDEQLTPSRLPSTRRTAGW